MNHQKNIQMKKVLFLSMLMLSASGIRADASGYDDDSLHNHYVVSEVEAVKPIRPTYLKGVTETANWGSNWFLEVKGGASAFIGQPVGCGDLFDRIEPAIRIGMGKWFTPSVGGRIGFQGFEFKNANLLKMKYQFVHADFLYNFTGSFAQDENGISRWDVIPFVGVGMIRNSSGVSMEGNHNVHVQGNHPFAFSYGIEARYHLGGRVHLIGEVSGITTLQNFDCVGSSGHFGDNFLNVSVGLSFTIGKNGWKKIIDAAPYIEQNNYLLGKYYALKKERASLSADTHQGKNDYSGLNSLRYRMSINQSGNESDSQLNDTSDGNATKISLGVPVYFYFKINTAKLVDNSQLSNLKEIAEIAREKNAVIKITGAADSATGSKETNRKLSIARAKFIGKQLMKYGIDKSMIQAASLGGINDYSPIAANRNTCVILIKE